MTDIEELLRESLRTAPPGAPAAADPVEVVSRRVSHVRRMWGAGLATAVAVAAAVVVPLATLGSSANDNLVVPGGQTPSPAVTADARGVAVWDTKDAVAVTAGDGFLWELTRNPSAKDGSGFVVKVDPLTHRPLAKWDVKAPADNIAYGISRVWVWGGGDGAYPDGLLQIVDPASADGEQPRSQSQPDIGFGGIAFLDGYAWVAAGTGVWQVAADGVVASQTEVAAGTRLTPVVAAGGSLWVGVADSSIVQLKPPSLVTHSTLDGPRPEIGITQGVADAPLRLLAAADAGTLVVSSGNDVRTEPLPNSAEGGPGDNGVALPAVVTAATVATNGDIVALAGTDVDAPGGIGVYDIPVDADGALCQSQTCMHILEHADAISLVANPMGGVDLVLADGTAEHWNL